MFDETSNMLHGELHVDIEAPMEAEYVTSTAPVKRVNRWSSKLAKTCWEENFVPGGSVCLTREWAQDGMCSSYKGCVSSKVGLSHRHSPCPEALC